MTVGELLERLAADDVDVDDVIVMSADGEGNSYSELYEVGCRHNYREDGEGEIKLRKEQLTDELKEKGWSEDDVGEGPDWKKAVVLWPG